MLKIKIAEYIEQNLADRPKRENKEWLANELGVNYKTLCGWFKRNSFDGLILTKMLDVLGIDFKEFSRNVISLSKSELISLFDKCYGESPYILKGSFDIKGKPYDCYSFSADTLAVGDTICFGNDIKIELTEVDILRLLKGYEAEREINSTRFAFYIENKGTALIRELLQEYDEVRVSFMNEVIDITKANVDEFLYAIHTGKYTYIGETSDLREVILVGDKNVYDKRVIVIDKFDL